MSLALLFHYILLNMFRTLIYPSSGACDLFDELFHGLYSSGSMCVGVTLWFGWGGVVSVCRLKHRFSLHTDTTPTVTSLLNKSLSLHFSVCSSSSFTGGLSLCMFPTESKFFRISPLTFFEPSKGQPLNLYVSF